MSWVLLKDGKPAAYRDVPILLADKTQRVGRINLAGTWELASYQRNKHQYTTSNVVAWFDTPQPPTM